MKKTKFNPESAKDEDFLAEAIDMMAEVVRNGAPEGFLLTTFQTDKDGEETAGNSLGFRISTYNKATLALNLLHQIMTDIGEDQLDELEDKLAELFELIRAGKGYEEIPF